MEAERALVATVVGHPDLWTSLDPLSADSFQDPLARALWTILIQRDGSFTPETLLIDLSLQAPGIFEQEGGRLGLTEFFSHSLRYQDAPALSLAIQNTARERSFEQILRSSLQNEQTLEDRLIRLQLSLEALTAPPGTSGNLNLGLQEWTEDLKWKIEHKGELKGILTGWRDIDDGVLDGMEPPNLIVIASGTGEGKSIFVGQLAAHCATRSIQAGGPDKVAFFGVEMSAREMINRWIIYRAKINADILLRGTWKEAELDRIRKAYLWVSQELQPNLSFFGPRDFETIDDITRIARHVAKKNGVKIIIVDYIQRVRSSRNRDQRTEEIGDITSKLKDLAHHANVVVIAISQITRTAMRLGGKPTLSDMSDSSSIEKDADSVLSIWRPARHLSGNEKIVKDFDNIAILELMKGRFRKSSSCFLGFNGGEYTFSDLDRPEIIRLRSDLVQKTLATALKGRASRDTS